MIVEGNITGEGLSTLLERADLSTVTVHEAELAKLQGIKAVFVVGSSGSGKTTVVNALRSELLVDPQLATKVCIPLRAVSRGRQNDDTLENTHLDFDSFEDKYAQGGLVLYWERYIEFPTVAQIAEFGPVEAFKRLRIERYGFLPPEEGKLPVYSANNAIVTNHQSLRPIDALDNALIVAVNPVYDDDRVKRLIERSPDLLSRQPELLARKWDFYFNVIIHSNGHFSHITIRNYGESEKRSTADFVQLVKILSLG